MSDPIKILSWNTSSMGQKRRLNGLRLAIEAHKPDIIALQEIYTPLLLEWENAMSRMGFKTLAFPFPEKPYCNLIASNFVLNRADTPWNEAAPFPNLLSRAIIATPHDKIDFFNVHIPNGTNHGMGKIDTVEVLVKELELPKKYPQIVVGDFNEPRLETLNGEVLSWGNPPRPKYTNEENARWDAVVLSFFEGKSTQMRDAFRQINGFEKQVTSVIIQNRKEPTRYDHSFVSQHFTVVACEYDLSVIERKLSDHALLFTEVAL